MVPKVMDGSYVSAEFPTFDVDQSGIDLSFLAQVIRATGFIAQLGGLSTGMGQRRQRVNIEDFLRADISLPSVSSQRRLAATLSKLDKLDALEAQARHLNDALLPAVRNQMFNAMR